jgi:hypothetical protein
VDLLAEIGRKMRLGEDIEGEVVGYREMRGDE